MLDYELIGTFVGCTGIGELLRGHVKHWLGYSAEQWCCIAMPFGGAALAITFWGLMYLKWGMEVWYLPLAFSLAGAAFYTLLGWLLHMEANNKAKKAESA